MGFIGILCACWLVWMTMSYFSRMTERVAELESRFDDTDDYCDDYDYEHYDS